jgi:hypothetical protein
VSEVVADGVAVMTRSPASFAKATRTSWTSFRFGSAITESERLPSAGTGVELEERELALSQRGARRSFVVGGLGLVGASEALTSRET